MLDRMLRPIVFAALFISALGCGGKSSPEDDGGTPVGSSTGGPSSESSSAGGSVAGSGSAPGTSASSSSSPPSGDADLGSTGQGSGRGSPIQDAAPPTPTGSAAPTSVQCLMGGGGGGSGAAGSDSSPSCETTAEGTCSGISYKVTCACPQATCACFGATTTLVPFSGCPGCPSFSQAFNICGFPH